jgi:hypothetical protein
MSLRERTKFEFKYALQGRGVTNYVEYSIQSSQYQVPAGNAIVSQYNSLNTTFLRYTFVQAFLI